VPIFANSLSRILKKYRQQKKKNPKEGFFFFFCAWAVGLKMCSAHGGAWGIERQSFFHGREVPYLANFFLDLLFQIRLQKDWKELQTTATVTRKSARKIAGRTLEKLIQAIGCSSDTMKKKRMDYNCEINLYFWDVLFVQWGDLFTVEWGQRNKKNNVITFIQHYLIIL